jgi:hypothetical protein
VNYYGISGCGFMVLLCVFILWASEHEEQVRGFVDFIVTRFIGPLAAPCPEEDADYERF